MTVERLFVPGYKDAGSQNDKALFFTPCDFYFVTAQWTPVEPLTRTKRCKQKIPSYTNSEMQLAAEPRVPSEPLLSLLASPSHNEITITKTRHIYTYSSELILTHIHHCQPTPSTINGI